MADKKKRKNKTPEEIKHDLVIQQQEKRKERMKECMTALSELEEKLGCTFVPVTHYKQMGGHIIGSDNYIMPVETPKEDVKTGEEKPKEEPKA